MSMQWIDRPRYQRALQIQLGLTPDQQAIVSSAAIDRAFAAEDQRRRLALMQLAAERDYRNASLNLRRRTTRADYDLRREQFDDKTDQAPLAQAVTLADVMLAGQQARQRLALDTQTAQELNRIRKKIVGG